MLLKSNKKISNVGYALEYTPRVLRLMALETKAGAYHISHYEQRLLNYKGINSGGGFPAGGSLIQTLKDMRQSIGGDRPRLVVGIEAADLILQCVQMSKVQQFYPQGRALLNAQPTLLSNYSWDMAPLTAYQGAEHYALWVAYPLAKINLLLALCTYCDFTLLAIEPCVCALARASGLLLQQPYGLFLLHEASRLNLFLVVQGEVYGLRQFTDPLTCAQAVQEMCADPKLMPYMEKLTTLFVIEEGVECYPVALPRAWQQVRVDVLQYVTTDRPYSVEGYRFQLLTCVGLALRSEK